MNRTDKTATALSVTRLTVPLSSNCDEALRRFEEFVETKRLEPLSTREAVLNFAAINAPYGFMLYSKMNVTALVIGSLSDLRCTEYLMGNHTIAEWMFPGRPDSDAARAAAFVICADENDDTQFVIDRPNDLFEHYGRPEIAEVGHELEAPLGTEIPAGLLD